ncbi:MAG: hypothetical protein LBH16_12500 [Treponema sp.]|jgi:hypothetical protein|nr:hypothetical protein [Treponema sp.]
MFYFNRKAAGSGIAFKDSDNITLTGRLDEETAVYLILILTGGPDTLLE